MSIVASSSLVVGDEFKPVVEHNSFFGQIRRAVITAVYNKSFRYRVLEHSQDCYIEHRDINNHCVVRLLDGPSVNPFTANQKFINKKKIYNIPKGSEFFLHNGYYTSADDSVYILKDANSEKDFQLCQ